MKRPLLIALGMLLSALAFAADTPNESSLEEASLQQEIGSEQAQLMESQISSLNEAIHWGEGFFFGNRQGSAYTTNYEIGYMYSLRRSPFAALSRPYIGKRDGYRIGFSVGYQSFEREIVTIDDTTSFNSDGSGFYGKINFGSPVLANFVSFSWHIKGMYAKPKSGNSRNLTAPRTVFGYGTDIEFWLTENTSASIGFTDEAEVLINVNEEDMIYPSRFRIVFGVKTFF